jgi:hypothetical protein
VSKKYCFDLDGTLCTNTEGDYEVALPFGTRISSVNRLFEEGNEITIFTARGSETGIDWYELTETQLKSWGVKYNRLILGKPFAHQYIDDRAISDTDFFKDSERI